MNWPTTNKLTEVDMLFIAGVLVGLVIAGLVGLAGVLWVVKAMVGG